MAFNPDRQVFLVLCNYGKHGLAWAERDVARTGRADTVEDIRSGELPDVEMVVELNVAEFSSRDVTEEIKRAAGRWFAEDAPPLTGQNLIDWRHDHARGLRECV